MDDKDLKKICLLCTIIGLSLLFIISTTIKPLSLKIIEINPDLINKNIEISGKAIYVKKSEGLTVLKIKDETGIIDAVIFEKRNINRNQEISLIGKVSRYKGKLQIIANSIEIKTK